MRLHQFEPRLTSDGSLTLYSETMQESYHSLHGAIQESRHIFIENGLICVQKTQLRVLEVGFGTGLNALLTWQTAKTRNLEIDYESLEAYPISEDQFKTLDYRLEQTTLPENAFQQLHLTDWGKPEILESGVFTLTKWLHDFTTFSLENSYDLVYFDAFSPDKQPEMWDAELFMQLYKHLNDNGILVTYCAKGEVRRRLQQAGFTTERLPGPPGKREMLRATKRPLD